MTHPIFVPEVFDALGDQAEAFQTARPFKHVVIDGLFQEAMLRAVADEFYPPADPRWHRFKDKSREVKLALQADTEMPPRVRELTRELNAAPFLRKLTELTGVAGLIPDPYMDGGGMHQIVRGGKLAIHADFNKQLAMKLDRRLNVLVYLNEGWDDAWGGQLELWDREMKACVSRVSPQFNRMVVFLTDDFSYHGHPDPLACPPDRTRKSVAMYYYTNGRPEEEVSVKEEAAAGQAHNTLFQPRPDEVFVEPSKLAVEAEQTWHRASFALRMAVPKPLRLLVKRLLKRG